MAWYAGDEVSIHEAAHAVAAVALGLTVERLTIEPTAGYAGCCIVGDGHRAASARAGKPLSAAVARRQLVVALAGRAAIGHQYPEPGRYSVDMDHAWQLARAVVGDDPAKAFHVAALVADCWERAQGLVDGLWQAVSATARQLEFWKTLEGEHAERVVREALDAQLASTWDAAREPAQAALAKYGRRRKA